MVWVGDNDDDDDDYDDDDDDDDDNDDDATCRAHSGVLFRWLCRVCLECSSWHLTAAAAATAKP
jgi:hypothetical protein